MEKYEPVGALARSWGLTFGTSTPGLTNTILDVEGLAVGHASAVSDQTRSGVTAVVPAARNLRQNPCRAGLFVANGYGKLVGATQLAEVGLLETPVLLTGTLSTFRVADTLMQWVLERPGNRLVRSVNPVVAETNDNWWGPGPFAPTVTPEHVRHALEAAATPRELQGPVGAGTGTRAFGFKSGIGSSSRVVPGATGGILGCLVQSNHDGNLPGVNPGAGVRDGFDARSEGSVVVLLATDLAVDARQLTRLAGRGAYALARTGADFATGSGDYCIAISTAPTAGTPSAVVDRLDDLASVVQDCVDEAVWNSLTTATDVRCNGRFAPALRRDDLH